MDEPTKKIWCCACHGDVEARLCTGRDIYPHRPDLKKKLFWRCKKCRNYVGCHPKSAIALGNIPTPALRAARSHIHAVIDPVWKSKQVPRGKIYAKMSEALGYEYHTGEIKSVEDARSIYLVAKKVVADLMAAAA